MQRNGNVLLLGAGLLALVLAVTAPRANAGDTISLTWNIGLANDDAQGIMNVTCGDTVAFKWVGNHDLLRVEYVPGEPCNFNTVLESVVPSVTTKPNANRTVLYTFDKAGTYHFVCTVREPFHCLMGQHVTFYVKGDACGKAGGPTPSPSPKHSPKPAPKPSPKRHKPAPKGRKSPKMLSGGRR